MDGHFGSKFLIRLQDALDKEDIEGDDYNKLRPVVREDDKKSSEKMIPSLPKPLEPASKMVAQQMACLRRNDASTAFAYNSIANQKRWCNASQFMSVLKSHDDFKMILTEEPLLEEAPASSPSSSSSSNGVVRAKLSCGRTLVWTCVVEGGG